MKKTLGAFLIALLALTVLGITCVFLFRCFVSDQIADKGGMMNPDCTDGDYTYVDNEKLLSMIAGTWSSEDGHYIVKADGEYRIVLSSGGETLLDSHIQFVYLQPGIVQSTEFYLDSRALQKEDGSSAGEIISFYHETSEEDTDGRLIMEIDLAGNRKTVEFEKQK